MPKKLMMNSVSKEKNSNDLFNIVDKLVCRDPGYYSFDGSCMELNVNTVSGHQRFFITKTESKALGNNWYDNSTHTNLTGIFPIKQGDVVKIEYVKLEKGSELEDFKSIIEFIGFNTNKDILYKGVFNELGVINCIVTEDDIFNTIIIAPFTAKSKKLEGFTFKIYLNNVLVEKYNQ